ncbi:MAG: TniB family NTP-binding protein [Trueperaceae bacterium]
MSDSHLTPETRLVLEYTEEARIAYIKQPLAVPYPKATEILKLLRTFYESNQARGAMLIGDNFNGKTTVIRTFCERYPTTRDPEYDTTTIPVLFVESPPASGERRLYSKVLETLNVPHNPNAKITELHTQIIRVLKLCHTKMLIIDNLHHCFSGTLRERQAMLRVLRNLCLELSIPIVGVGSPELLGSKDLKVELNTSFPPTILPRWKNDDVFKSLLATFEERIPLRKPSGLSEDGLAKQLHTMSEGLIGELAEIFRRAATRAVEKNQEAITKATLENIEWVSPKHRRTHAQRLLRESGSL